MIGFFSKSAHYLKSSFWFRLYPRVVDFVISISVSEATRRLKAANVRKLLIDNTVLAHSVTHETAWIDTGKAQWGDIEIDTGYAARIPVHDDGDIRDAARSVRYLPGIAHLARHELIVLLTSKELQDERLSQPSGRFRGYGIYDYSLFRDIKFETIRDSDYSMVIGSSYLGIPSIEEQRRKRLESKTDPLFRQLVSILGPNNSQDAWHIATAEHNDCYCFLTMDFKLINNVRAQAKNPIIERLRTKVLTPEEFGREFRIIPIPPRFFSYHNASYPVERKTNWKDSKRQKRRRG
jgi:hypothetical protein